MRPQVEIKVLGPLEVRDAGGCRVAVGGDRRRRLLAVLASRPNAIVETDRLVDLVWEGEPPGSAPKTLRSYVHRLRRALETGADDSDGAELIVTRPPGYVLVVGDIELDALRVERMLAEAERLGDDDPAAAAARVEDALGLWRGEPFGEFAHEDWAVGQVARLEELRSVATERLFELQLDLGRHRETLASIQGYVSEYSLRERGWTLLMLALYRAGRQPDALRAYQDYLEVLATETGLEPGPDAVEMERRILVRDPELDLEASSTRAPAAARPGVVKVPSPVSSFVGRRREIAELVQLVDEHRLLTLSGPGGIGKTRLAVRLVEELTGRFSVIVFVDFAGLEGPEGVQNAILDALAMSVSADRDPIAALEAALGHQPSLLVLDCFEHVMEASPLVGSLLDAVPSLRVIATSRQLLHLRGEHNYPVAAMEVPEADDTFSLEELAASEGLALFTERARSVSPIFELDQETAPDVGAICRMLDGLPLAIELAAARIRTFPPSTLVERLKVDLSLVGSGPVDAPERHRTLDGLARWSFDLLDDDEKTVLARLSVFKGGAEIEAIDRVCASDLAIDAFEAVDSLVDKSLIRAVSGRARHPRFAMLDTINAFAAQRLAESGDSRATRLRHLEHFVELAETAAAALSGPHQVEWSRRLADDRRNIEAALTLAFDEGHPDQGARIIGALRDFWNYWGPERDLARWVRRALDAPRPADPHLWAYVIIAASFASEYMGHTGLPERYDEELDLLVAAEILRSAGDVRGESIARIYSSMNSSASVPVDLDESRQRIYDGIELARSVGADDIVARGLVVLAELERWAGNLEAALQTNQECLHLAQQIGDIAREVIVTVNIGSVERRLDRLDEALALQRRALRMELATDLNGPVPVSLIALGEQAAIRGSPAIGARIVGAVDGALDRHEAMLTVVDAEDRERTHELLRSSLGDEAHAAETAAGRSLSIHEAVELVEQTLGPLT